MEMEEKIINELKPKLKPQQLLRDWQRRVRQAPGLQREEENVQKTIKKASKPDGIGSAKMVKDIQSDLYALKRLYGLLKKDGDETSDTSSDSLDAHSRLLLKNLLDAETKRALKLHAEMIAGQVEASDETQLSQSCKNDLVISDKDKSLNRLDITLRKENRSNPQWNRAGTVEQSEPSMVGNGPDYQSKRCRVCRRNTLKRLDSIENATFYDVGAQDSNSFFDENNVSGNNNKDEQKIGKGRQSRPLSSDSNSTVYTDVSSDMMVSDFDEVCNYDMETTNKRDEPDRVSEEASEVIKQIELCISAFQIGADHLHLFEESQNCFAETKSVSPAPQTRYGAVSRPEMRQTESSFQDRLGYLQHHVPCSTTEEINLPFFSSSHPSKVVQPSNAIWRQSAYHFMGESTGEHKFPVYGASNFYGQNVNAIIDKIDPGNCITSLNETSNGTPSWPVNVIIDSASRTKSPYQRRGVIEHENNKHRQFRSSDSFMYLNNNENARSVDSGLHVALTSGVHGKNPPPQLLVGQGQSYAKYKNGNPKNRQHYMTAKERLVQQKDSEGTPTDSYSSNSISHQTSSGNSDSKEMQYVSRSTSSESCGSPLSQGSESQYSSYTSNSENEVYSSTPSGSSNSDASSSYSQPIERRAGPTYSMSKKSSNEVKHKNKNKKQSGTWKKLKDGLAIIFHHHHHHHHHHNQDDNEAKLKYKGKNNHFKREDEANGERAGKAMVRDKDQKAHFHGLMEGLLRHVRRSKKSKIGKETVGQLGKGQNRKKKKSMKKSQWLKLLQHHRAASKAHVKLGFGKKRTRLKALPNLE